MRTAEERALIADIGDRLLELYAKRDEAVSFGSLPPSFRDVAFLAKPYTREELIEATSRLITKNAASFPLRKT